MDEEKEQIDEQEAEADEEATEEAGADDSQPDEESQNESEDDDEEDPQLLKERLRIAEEKAARYQAERDRLKDRDKQAKDKTEKPVKSDELAIIRLEARGYIRQDEQQEIIRAAKSMGVSIPEAAEDEYVLSKIERMRKARRAAQSVDAPSSTGSPIARKDVDYYIRKGVLPTDSKMLEKVQVELARRAGAGYSKG